MYQLGGFPQLTAKDQRTENQMNQIALGIDPGIANTGYAIVARTSRKFRVIESGRIKTKAADPTPHRLNTIFKAVSEVVYRHITGIDIF